MKLRIVTGIILGLSMLWSAAMAGPAPAKLLYQLHQLGSQYNYSGYQTTVFVTPEGPRICRVQITHRRPCRTLTRYLESGRIVLQEGRRVYQYEPGSRFLLVSDQGGCARLNPQKELRLLLRNYRPELLGQEEIAGRITRKVHLHPRHPGNASQIFWIDMETGLPLKTAYLSPDNELQAFSYFTRIRFPKQIEDHLFRLPAPKGLPRLVMASPREYDCLKSLESQAGFDILAPIRLPPGYIFAGGSLLIKSPLRSVVLRFTDGLNTISIFQEPAFRGGPRHMEVCPGMLQQACRWRSGDLYITVVGNLSQGQMMALYRSMDAQREQQLMGRISQVWGVPPSRLAHLRDIGLGFDDIITLLTLSGQMHRDIERLSQLWTRELYDRDMIIRRFRADTTEIDNLIRKVLGSPQTVFLW